MALGDGTQIDLEHRGWEEFGADAGQALRDSYNPGWDSVLESLVLAESNR